MSIFGCLTAFVFVLFPKPGQDLFTIILIGYGIASSYVDALAEGITSIITKLNERIAILEAGGKGEGNDESMKALGLFSSFRGILKSGMIFFGGFMVQQTKSSHLFVSGIIMAGYPLLFCIQLFFVFKEKKVKKTKFIFQFFMKKSKNLTFFIKI